MILTINVSNSNVLIGGYQNGERHFCSAMHTNVQKSADEYAVQLRALLSLYRITPSDLDGVILSCVVPALLGCIRKAVSHLYTGRIYTVGPGLKTGLQIRMDDPAQLGSELVCIAAAAQSLYPLPCIIISMDTATSFVVLDKKGTLRGGAVVPGMKIGLDALCARTAQLPQVDICAPSGGVLGTNSVSCMQSGVVFGTASMIDGMIDRFASTLGESPFCIASGELCPVVLPHCTHPIQYHEHLVLDGLYRLYLKNTK